LLYALYMVQADYTFLPVEVFMSLLHHRYLAVKSEHHLFNTVCAFVKAKIPLLHALLSVISVPYLAPYRPTKRLSLRSRLPP